MLLGFRLESHLSTDGGFPHSSDPVVRLDTPPHARNNRSVSKTPITFFPVHTLSPPPPTLLHGPAHAVWLHFSGGTMFDLLTPVPPAGEQLERALSSVPQQGETRPFPSEPRDDSCARKE